MFNSHDEEPMFTLDMHDEILLRLITRPSPLSIVSDAAIIEFRMPEGSLYQFMIWLAERRHLWGAWRTMGLALGNQAAGRQVASLWETTSSIDRLKAFDINYHPDLRTVDLVAEYEGRTAVLANHRFATPDDLSAFVKLYMADDPSIRWDIFRTTCLSPIDALKTLIASLLQDAVDPERSGRTADGRETMH